MDLFLLLAAIVFAAAALQAATGVGFGVIGGPVLLAVLNDSAAVQISVVLNLVIALLMLPLVWRACDRQLLWPIAGGLIIGSPLGFMLFLHANLVTLKLLAATFVLTAMAGLLIGNRRSSSCSADSAGTAEKTTVGVIAGIMSGSLAIPGPVPASWMAVKGHSKITIRATILVMFVFAYSIVLLLQIVGDGLSELTIAYSTQLALPTVAGIAAGQFLSSRISERLFRNMLVVVLAATVISLFATLGVQ